MANQLKMADVQAILALHRAGWSDRRIARELVIDRGTVGQYLKSTESAGNSGESAGNAGPIVSQESAGAVPEPEGASGDLCGVCAGSKPASAPSGSSAPESVGDGPDRSHLSVAWPWREVIAAKLEQGLDAQRIYQDLRDPETHAYTGSYYSVRRLAKKLGASRPLPVRRMECEAGAEAQVDFGKGASILDATGRRRKSWVFRIVLSHSRKGYSEAVLRQGTDEFLRCLENAFAHFGGVSRTLVIDNLRAAVSRADWYDPELCPKVRSFAEHYGIAILPTRPRMPRHKGKVENGVKYVKASALKGLSFGSLAEENRHLEVWESRVADTRIHGTTRRQVLQMFLEVEKPALLPLPPERFALFSEALRRVQRDGHVQVAGAYYSLPPEYLGQGVWARWDGRVVRLFDEKMRAIAVHVQRPAGSFSTTASHLHPHKINGLERGPDWLLGQVAGIGPQARTWAEGVLQARGIEGARVVQGLLHLSRKHGSAEVERACQVAAERGAWHLRSLRQLVEKRPVPAARAEVALIEEHPIIRALDEYARVVRELLGEASFNHEECA